MIYTLLLLISLFTATHHAIGEELLRPYILGSTVAGQIDEQIDAVTKALQEQGFTIVGRYTPYETATILIVGSDELSSTAAKTRFGGYGAVQRVSLTQVGDQVQIAYTNPIYIANAYRLDGQLTNTAKKLETALGRQMDFGSKNGISAKALRKYHYTFMMPHFDNQDELAQYASHAEAISAVEAGLTARASDVEKIYRVNLGNEMVLFGVAIKTGSGADVTVMKKCDNEALKHTPYMPYELLVIKNKAYALKGKFRIAVSFPDLSMGTFMKISGAPGAIHDALQEVANP